MVDEIRYSSGERIEAEEYLEFLGRSELGRMYPKKNFLERIPRLLARASVVVSARDEGRLVGVGLGITDFTYFLFLTDLGVDRSYTRRGIGRRLLARILEAAGGAEDITAVTWSNRAALPFYAASGLVPQSGLIAREAPDWELFDIRELPIPKGD